jgi:hypothetical protein
MRGEHIMSPAPEPFYPNPDQQTRDDWTPEELEARRTARDAVMEIPLFPELPVRLKQQLGYGSHVDMLQHFIYWFNPDKPKMHNRWTLYKTYEEWHGECGLSDRQVKKGRKRLNDLGLLTWKRGQYGRVHYRLDWVALAKILNPDAVGGRIEEVGDDLFDLEDEFNPDTKASRLNPDTKATSSIRTV